MDDINIGLIHKCWLLKEGKAQTDEGFWWVEGVVYDFTELSTIKSGMQGMYLRYEQGSFFIMYEQQQSYFKVIALSETELKLGMYVQDDDKKEPYLKVILELEPVPEED